MQRTKAQTPLGAVARGLAAGVVGTALMTVAQELSARLPSSGDSQPQGDPPRLRRRRRCGSPPTC